MHLLTLNVDIGGLLDVLKLVITMVETYSENYFPYTIRPEALSWWYDKNMCFNMKSLVPRSTTVLFVFVLRLEYYYTSPNDVVNKQFVDNTFADAVQLSSLAPIAEADRLNFCY